MLKKTITYTDYNNNKRTEDFYFNLSKAEAAELEMSVNGGLHEYLTRIAQSQDNAEIVKFFKEFIKKTYGVKSIDGKRFIKNDEVFDEFYQSEAYTEFFMELAESTDAMTDFVNGVLSGIDAAQPQDHKQKEPAKPISQNPQE